MACCGMKNQEAIRKSLEHGPLVYSSSSKPKAGKCPVCHRKGKSATLKTEGELVRAWICQKGHVIPWP